MSNWKDTHQFDYQIDWNIISEMYCNYTEEEIEEELSNMDQRGSLMSQLSLSINYFIQ